jgi:hypothetical protein
VSGATQQQGVSAETLAPISTHDRVETHLGTLEFTDGAPSKATARLLYDHLDFVHGPQAFINAFRVRRWGLRVDGLGVAVPDRELRHGRLPQLR